MAATIALQNQLLRKDELMSTRIAPTSRVVMVNYEKSASHYMLVYRKKTVIKKVFTPDHLQVS